MTEEKTKQCLVCARGSDAIPLVMFEYRGQNRWICPQHLPILIHKPGQLVGHLDGAENLEAAEHH